MDIKQKWINDKQAKIKGEIEGLKRRVAQLQEEIQTVSIRILMKQGELQAIEEVGQELKRKPEPAKKVKK